MVPPMQNDVVPVAVKGVMPTANGCAVFLGNDDKTFVIYVDPSVGSAISMTINGVKKERPLTHDLIGHLLMGFEIGLERIIRLGEKPADVHMVGCPRIDLVAEILRAQNNASDDTLFELGVGDRLDGVGLVEAMPKLEGRQMIMIISPKKKK